MAIPARRSDPANITSIPRTFFVTSSISGKRNLLQSDRSARLFTDVLYHYRPEQKYLLHAFVVMPDHFHALITPGSEISIERGVQFIKGGLAFRAGRKSVSERRFGNGDFLRCEFTIPNISCE
jgi:putative transposase